MDFSHIDIQIPSEQSAHGASWTDVSNGDSHPDSLELRIQQMLDKWMVHFDRRFDTLSSSQIGWGSHGNGYFKDVLNLSRGPLVDFSHGIGHEREESNHAGFAEQSNEICAFKAGEDSRLESGTKQQENFLLPRSTRNSHLDLSAALRGRWSMQQKMDALFDNLALKKQRKPRLCGQVAQHTHFETFMSFAIILNGLFIGVQVDMAARGSDGEHVVFSISEFAFFTIFFVELLLRLCGSGLVEWSKRGWNIFECLLVLVQIIEFVVKVAGENEDRGSTTGRILRVFRIVRIVRVVRLLRFFVQLRVMVKMITFSLGSLFWLMIFLLVMMCVVSIIFTQGVTHYRASDGVDWENARFLAEQFGDIPTSTLTLFKAITNGIAWGDLCDPLFEVHAFLGSLFVFFVFFVFFSVLNVVTGVFVDGAIQHGGQERELLVAAERKNLEGMCLRLMELLVDIDTNNSGTITIDELVQACNDPTFSSYFTALQIHTQETVDLFEYLDSNHDGEIDTQEFIDGCMRIRGGAKNIDLHMLFSTFTSESKKRMTEIESLLRIQDLNMARIDNQISSVKADICKIPAIFCGPRGDQIRTLPSPKHVDSCPGEFVHAISL